MRPIRKRAPRPIVREVLVSSIANATYLLSSQKIAYEFVNFATKGVFPGGRYAYLMAHNDDLFLPNGLWDPALNPPATNDNQEYRITPRTSVTGDRRKTS